ncbi:MAG: ABC transporter permease [Candidatus Staskawiczbacteria bacterium]|jgi:ABC-type polysaccharide/polyol phosphate export permease
MSDYSKKIKSIFGLSFQLAKAEFKLRNEGSYFGIFWYLLNPLLAFSLLYLVFSDRLGSNIPRYPLYLLLGIIMFNFFQGATIESLASIIKDYKSVIKSINFPREALTASIVLKNLFSHFFEVIFFTILLIFFKVSVLGLLYYFLILIFFCLFIFGASLILSSLAVYFIDLEGIWSFVVRLLWLGTPIFYTIAGQVRLYYINLFNPMYYFITIARDAVIYSEMPDILMLSGMVFYTLLSFVVGILLFNILKTKFAEKI